MSNEEMKWERWLKQCGDVRKFIAESKYPADCNSKQEKRLLRKKANIYCLEKKPTDDMPCLMYKAKKDVKVVETLAEARELFKQFHSSNIGGHSGVNKTIDAIARRFFWPGFSVDIKEWISFCERCQKTGPLNFVADLQPIKVTGPWEMLGVDLIGPLTLTKNNNRFILTATDYYTKWVEAFPIKDKTAHSAASCLLEIFYRHGASNCMITDQGREFVNKINAELCDKLEIDHRVTAAYHPQTNGLDERTNQTIKRALRKVVSDQGDDWDRHLGAVLFALRTKTQITTKFSPFRLLYHREARYPAEMPDGGKMVNLRSTTEAEERHATLESSSAEIVQTVLNNIEDAQAKQSVSYNKRKRSVTAPEVGALVLRYNAKKKARKGDPLGTDYQGPYRLLDITGKKCQLANMEGTVLKVKYSLDHLKLFKQSSDGENAAGEGVKEEEPTEEGETVEPTEPVTEDAAVREEQAEAGEGGNLLADVDGPAETEAKQDEATPPQTVEEAPPPPEADVKMKELRKDQFITFMRDMQKSGKLQDIIDTATEQTAFGEEMLRHNTHYEHIYQHSLSHMSSLKLIGDIEDLVPILLILAPCLRKASQDTNIVILVIDLLMKEYKASVAKDNQIKMPPKLKKRGRPKGLELTTVGLPRKKSKTGSKGIGDGENAAGKGVKEEEPTEEGETVEPTEPVTEDAAVREEQAEAGEGGNLLADVDGPAETEAKQDEATLPQTVEEAPPPPEADVKMKELGKEDAMSTQAAGVVTDATPGQVHEADPHAASTSTQSIFDMFEATATVTLSSTDTTADMATMNHSFMTFTFPDNALSSIWRRETNYLEAKVGPYKLYGNSFHSLKNEKPLTDEILNAYLHQAVERSKFDFTKYEIVVGAINENGNHWSLMVIYPHQQKLVYLNPLGGKEISGKLLRTWRNFMYHRYRRDIDTAQTNYTILVPNHPKQGDSINCGAFVMKFADAYLFDVGLETMATDGISLKEIRKEIALMLLDQSEDMANHCRKCGSIRTDSNTPSLNDKWVKCDQCTRWFHQRCVPSQDFDLNSFNCLNCVNCDTTNITTKLKPYKIIKRGKRVKKCQGCPVPFAPEPIPLCVMRYQNIPFFSRALGCFHSAWRNYYYHLDLTCISHRNPEVAFDDIEIGQGLSKNEIEFAATMGFI